MNDRTSDSALAKTVAGLSEKLLRRRLSLATAESCTGGWIAKCCTDRAGSSAWFERGFVTYSNAAKHDLLGVDAQVLEQAGAVSEIVARQMAAGAVSRSAADVSVAVTGIAGPDGGSADKPVGTVWFGWSLKGAVSTDCRVFDGDRDSVRRQAVAHALGGLIDRL
ncbi:MAG: nicotinamide-nucleotide amidohydrolase family protein [Xanthomonadales bacterium]|jgi:nicotinamide-nucleotide amidase|nr:nicotinamide-nucleotide amidohydrolase family protein [Xanthomonadales bacterium]